MMGKRSEGKMVLVTRWILNFMLVSGVLVFVSLPFLLQYAGDHYAPIIKEHYVLYLIVYLISGVMGIIIVYCLRKMIGPVIRRNCFVDENVRELNIMGMSGCVITVTFLIKEILAWTAAGIVIVIVFFIAALFSFVLAGVFAEAVRYKKENDLTI